VATVLLVQQRPVSSPKNGVLDSDRERSRGHPCSYKNLWDFVLDWYLAQQKQERGGTAGSDGPWLVGKKVSYAEIAFIPWQTIVGMVLEKDEYNEDNFPHAKEWLGKMTSRETVKTVVGSPPGRAIRTNFLACIYLRCTSFLWSLLRQCFDMVD